MPVNVVFYMTWSIFMSDLLAKLTRSSCLLLELLMVKSPTLVALTSLSLKFELHLFEFRFKWLSINHSIEGF